MKRPDRYATEVDLCASFCRWLKANGWVAYPETGGFDIIAVWPGDGTQVGVQAKMGMTLEVVNQIVPPYWDRDVGPDFRAVLVPGAKGGARDLLQALGVVLIEPDYWSLRRDEFGFTPPFTKGRNYTAWHFWNPARRVALPEYVPDVAAGASGPSQLTEWKIKALRLLAVLELRGYLVRADFREVDHRAWMAPGGWLVPGKTPGEYVAGPRMPDFKGQHPVVYPQVLEDVRGQAILWRSSKLL